MGRKIELELTDTMIEAIVRKVNEESNTTWEELIDEYNIPISRDHFRKVSYGIELLYAYMNEKDSQLMSMDAYQKLLKKELNVKMQIQQLSDLRALVNRESRELSREKNLLDIAHDYVDKLNTIDKLICTGHKEEGNYKDAGVLLISDVHYGLDVKVPSNTYNPEVCIERFNTLFNDVVEYSKLNDIGELNVFLLGDLINGLIHTTTRLENREQVVIQTLKIANIISKFIFELNETKLFTNINVYFATGNHARVISKAQDNTLDDDFGIIIKSIIKDRLQAIENINIIDNKYENDIIICDIMGNKIFAVHGDKDKIENCYQHLTRLTGEIPDFIFLGHYHHLVEDCVGRTEVIANGGFAGDVEYSNKLRLTSRPTQRFMIFNEKGRKCTYNITLD